jgi:phosphoribulokinase
LNTTKQEKKVAAYLVQTSDWCWGKGTTLEEAIKSARAEGSKVTKTGRKIDYVVFEFDDNVKYDSIFIDGMGSSRWEVHTPDEAAGFSQGLVTEWVHRNGKDEPLKGGE